MTKRILAILAVLISMLLYIPVNRLVSGGYVLATPLDDLIPIVPIFVLPYMFGILYWVTTIIYINLKAKNLQIKRFNLMMVIAGILSVVIYLLLPTYVVRPTVNGNDIFSNLLNFVYANDNVNNAAPSGHTFFTILCYLNLIRILPKQKLILGIISGLIILSTVFTKQHNVLDVLTGTIFALGIYYLIKKVE